MADISGAGVEFSIGKSPGTPFSELDIAAEVQHSGGPEPLYVLPPPLRAASPLQQNGPQPRKSQHQRGKEPRRARSNHHRRQLRRLLRRGRMIIRAGRTQADLSIPGVPEHRSLLRKGDLHGVNHKDALPSIHTAPQYLQVPQIFLSNFQDAGGLGSQRRLTGARGQLYIFNLEHSGPPYLLPVPMKR